MSSAVPPRREVEPTTVPWKKVDDDRADGHDAQEEGAREADPVDHLGKVVPGRGARPDARDEAAVLAELVRRLIGLERERRVEVREADRQQEVQQDVQRRPLVEQVDDGAARSPG